MEGCGGGKWKQVSKVAILLDSTLTGKMMEDKPTMP